MDIKGKVAVVVGGASGMARASAELLAARGASVAIVDLPTSAGKDAAAAIGGATSWHPCDILDAEGTEAVLDAVVEAHGALHIAVNTAGGGIAKRTLGKDGPHDLESFRKVVELNLNRLEAAHMARNEPDEEQERGVIIDTASIAAFEGQIGQVAYSASKAGIAGMTLSMARDLGSLGIRVMAIAPSLFETGAVAGMPEETKSKLTQGAAFPHRMGHPGEYAKLVAAIVDNPMLNGGTIRLDAGQRFAPR